MVGQPADLLLVSLMADFRAAEDDDEIGAKTFEGGNKVEGLFGVPDIHGEAEDARLVGEDALGDVECALVDVEFEETSARLEIAEVGEKTAQSESAVRVPGIERGEENLGHVIMIMDAEQ